MADLRNTQLGGLDTSLGQNYDRAAPSSMFGTRDLKFYSALIADSNVIPFEVTFLGETYTQLFVGTNSYVTFGAGSSTIPSYNDGANSIDGYPAIIISGEDNSYQNVYSGVSGDAGSRKLRIRYEGLNSADSTDDPANIIWEMTFYENLPGVIDLVIVKNALYHYEDGLNGITDGTDWQDGFSDHAASNWGFKGSWRIDALGTTATVTPGNAVEKGSEGLQAIHIFNHDNGIHEEDDDYVRVTGLVYNGGIYSRAIRAIQSVSELYYIGQPNVIDGFAYGFVFAVADTTADGEAMSDALSNELGMTAVIPMTVGPESIYLDI